jgi:tryptophan-rich sensory protein
MKLISLKSLPYLLLPLAAVLLVNAVIFRLRWDQVAVVVPSILNPPGWLIGGVWVGLILLMGVAIRQIRQVPSLESLRIGRLIIGLIVFCLCYPFYTLGLKNEAIGLAGNIATFLFAAIIIAKAWPLSRTCAWLLFPILPWLVYASAITAYLARLN